MDGMSFLRSRLWRKVILVCLLIGTVPSLSIGVFSYYRSAGVVEGQVIQTNIRELGQVRLAIEIQMAAAENLMLQLVDSQVVLDNIDTPLDGANFVKFNELARTIASLPNLGFTIGDISLINLRENWAVDSGGVYPLSDYEIDKVTIEPYMKDSRYSYWVDEMAKKSLGVTETQPNCLTLVKRYVGLEDECLATMDLPYSSFSSLISKTSSFNSVYVVSDDGCVLYSDKTKDLGVDMSSSPMIQRIEKDKANQGSLKMMVGGENSVVSYVRSSDYRWLYILVTPLSGLHRNTQTIGLFTLIVCLVMTLLVAAFSIFVSGLAYRPVMKLYQTLTHARTDDARDESDEFQVITQTVSLLMTDQKRLQQEIFTQSDYLKRYFLLKLLLGGSGSQKLSQRLSMYGAPEEPPRMAILVFCLDALDGTPYSEEDTDLLLYAVENVVGELFQNRFVVAPVLLEDHQVTILSIREGADYQAEVTEAVGNLQQIVKSQLEFTVSAVVSRELHDYNDIHIRYAECMEAMRYHTPMYDDAILFIENFSKTMKKMPIYPEKAEREMFDAIRACDRGKCMEMIHQFVGDMLDIESNRSEGNIFLSRLVDGMTILQEETGSHAGLPNIRHSLLRMKGAAEIERWLGETADSIMQNIRQSQKDRYRCISHQMMTIIQTEYDTKLTLESCAARLNYHPNYLRRIFEEEYGASFSEFLMKYRINVAKNWLVDTDMRILDIAERLKYQNTSNFIRCFKKAIGVTPKQYRDSVRTPASQAKS